MTYYLVIGAAIALLVVGYLVVKTYDVLVDKNNVSSCVFFKAEKQFEHLNNISDCLENQQFPVNKKQH
jgi:hypothetical protein